MYKLLLYILLLPLVLVGQVADELDSQRLTYELYDSFTLDAAAGAVNATFAVPGPGKRTIVDTENRLYLVGGKAVLTPKTVTHQTDPLLRVSAIARQNGKVIYVKAKFSSVSDNTSFGFGNTDSSNFSGCRFRVNVGDLTLTEAADGNTSAVTVGTVAADTYYDTASVLRLSGWYGLIKGGIYNQWTLLYHYKTRSDSPVYWKAGNNTTTQTIDVISIPTERLQIRPIAYSVFTGSDGTELLTTDAVSADGYNISPMAWNNSAWYVTNNCATVEPVVGSDVVVNGGFDSDTTGWGVVGSGILASVTGGADGNCLVVTNGAASQAYAQATNTTTIGKFYVADAMHKNGSAAGVFGAYTGSAYLGLKTLNDVSWAKTTITFRSTVSSILVRAINSTANLNDYTYFDSISLKPLDLTNLVETVSTDQTNVLISCNLTNIAGTQCGVVARWNPTTQSGVFGYHDGTTAKLETVTNGTNWTTVLSVTTTYSAGARIKMVIDGTTASLYYNEALITGSPASVTGPDGTQHGIFNTYSGNRCDNLEIHYRRHPSWTSYFDKWTKD